MGQAALTGLKILLALVIVGLGYLLYDSIITPYAVVEQQKALTEMTRERMDKVRKTMIRYEEVNERFVTTLDSLVMFAKTDSALVADKSFLYGDDFVLDSLVQSPRTGKRFMLTVDDTSRVKVYMLEDPDSDDRIGSLEQDVTLLNAASWE
ncbi:MAG: hypothetical protein RhofKO_33170 [Rhodothermales bacterium]